MQVIAYANVDSPERILHVHHIPGKKNPSDTWTKFQKDVRDYHFCRATNLNLPIDPQNEKSLVAMSPAHDEIPTRPTSHKKKKKKKIPPTLGTFGRVQGGGLQ
jgi:hypothetical protein